MGECNTGKVSYLGGHAYNTNVAISGSDTSQGARLFLNALFEADCVTSVGQPDIALGLQGDLVIGAQTVPVEGELSATYVNNGRGPALDAMLSEMLPAGVELVDAAGGAPITGGAEWSVGSISGNPPQAGDPPHQGARGSTLQFADFGEYPIEVRMQYRVGQTTLEAPVATITVRVALDSDGDGVPDEDDSDPDDPNKCGDDDGDTCDDCAKGSYDPSNDGPDDDGDGICNAGDDDGGNPGDGDASGCGCETAPRDSGAPALLLIVACWLWTARRARAARATR
jgi:hypothetical protein